MTLALSALVLASIADVLTTRAGIRSGLLVERNPLMRWATRTTTRAVAVKIIGLGIAMTLAFGQFPTRPSLTISVFWIGAIGTGYLAWQNHRTLRAVQREFPV